MSAAEQAAERVRAEREQALRFPPSRLVEILREEAQDQRRHRDYFSPEPGSYGYVDHYARETVASAFESLASAIEGAIA